MPAEPQQTYVVSQWPVESPLLACRFDPAGRFVFASCEDNSIQRFDLATGKPLALKAHESWVNGFGFTPDGQMMVSGGCDGRLIWWPVAGDAPVPIRTVEAHQGWIRALAVSPDGKLVATGGNDKVLRLWNLADGTLVREFPGLESHIYSVLFHPTGQFLLTGELKGHVRQWDVASGAAVRTFDAKALWSYNGGQGVDFGGVRALAISADGKQFACGGLHNASNPLGAVHDPLVMLFEWESQKLMQSLIAEPLKGAVWRLTFLPDGTLLGASGGSTGGHLVFWNASQNKDIHRFQLPNIVRDLDLHPDGIQVATTHHDKHLRISRMASKPA